MPRCAVVLFVVCAAIGSAFAQTAPSPFDGMPGVVIDGPGATLFVARPGGGLANVSLVDGTVRCRTDLAAWPLHVGGGRLLAQVESGGPVLTLRLFDPGADGCAFRTVATARVALPSGVRALVDDRIDGRFEIGAIAAIEAMTTDAATVTLAWSYRQSPALPAEDAIHGRVRVALADGAATALDDPTPVARASRALPLRGTEGVRAGASTVEVRVGSDGRRTVELLRAGRRPRTIDRGDLRAVRLAADDRTLLVSRWVGGADPARRYAWSIHDLDSGARIAEHAAPRASAPFVLAADRLIHLEDRTDRLDADPWVERPLRVVAIDPADGREVWSVHVRDPGYRGVRPPRQPAPGVRGTGP